MRLDTQSVPKGHILVADDDEGVRDVVTWALESAGLQVKSASTGSDAIRSVEQEAPDLLVLDLTMPTQSGTEVAEEIRSQQPTIPILLITGDGHAREKAKVVGAYDYLHKPFEMNELIAAVKRGLNPPA